MDSHQLPATFEAFSDARQKGFLRAKAVKEAGGLIAGTFCTFTPNEIFDAAGIHTVSLCGTSDETVPFAEEDLPKNLCPLIKSSYGFAVSDRCPYTYFSDLIVGETTCDGKKKMYELLGRIKDMYVMHLPQATDREHALPVWKAEIRRLIKALEDKFGLTITEDALRRASEMRNRQRQLKLSLMELQRQTPPPLFTRDLFKILDSTNFSFDQEESNRALEEALNRLQAAYAAGERPVSQGCRRILVTGCPIGGVLEKTIGIIESSGGVVVCMENCSGIKPLKRMVDTDNPDIIEAIAERYLGIGCAVMSPNPGRMALLRELCAEYKVEGIVDIVLQSCHHYSIERYEVRETARELGLPYMSVETDYSPSDSGQLSTRLGAFIEML